MKANKTLTTIQTEAVESILAARPQGKRAAAFGHTLLNRNPRVLRGIRNTYERQAAQMGFKIEQIAAQWNDVRDVWHAYELVRDNPWQGRGILVRMWRNHFPTSYRSNASINTLRNGACCG